MYRGLRATHNELTTGDFIVAGISDMFDICHQSLGHTTAAALLKLFVTGKRLLMIGEGKHRMDRRDDE